MHCIDGIELSPAFMSAYMLIASFEKRTRARLKNNPDNLLTTKHTCHSSKKFANGLAAHPLQLFHRFLCVDMFTLFFAHFQRDILCADKKLPLKDAMAHVEKLKSDVCPNDGFISKLIALEKKLFGCVRFCLTFVYAIQFEFTGRSLFVSRRCLHFSHRNYLL